MALTTYRKKRNFKKTSEPSGLEARETGRGAGLVYVIQKHQASRLHWDLRLQEGDALASWAIPKEPPAEEGLRRLAVQVEDHPLSYASFKGMIPEGEYGGGKVEIWDSGVYVPIEKTSSKRVFEIQGRRLSGPYVLVKLKAEDPQDKNWLFFKLKKKGRP